MRPAIFKPIHYLALLLCTLLSCCTQDDAIDVPTSVPLQLSAVIEGSGTRAISEKSSFSDCDEITVTIDGDKSGTKYSYKYNELVGKWVPSDSNNQILISDTTTALSITARYSEDDGSRSLDSKLNDYVAAATVSFSNPNAKFQFTHEACMLQINILSFDGNSATLGSYSITVSEGENTVVSSTESNAGTTIQAYVPKTSTEAEIALSDKTYKFTLSNLEAGKTYVCNICTNFIEAKDAAIGDAYLENGTFARVTDGDEVNETKVAALEAYAKSRGTSVWGVYVYYGGVRGSFIAALNDYVSGDKYLFTATEMKNANAGNISYARFINNSSKAQNVIKALGGSLLVTDKDEHPYYWYGHDITSSTGEKGYQYYDASEDKVKDIFQSSSEYDTLLARIRQMKVFSE